MRNRVKSLFLILPGAVTQEKFADAQIKGTGIADSSEDVEQVLTDEWRREVKIDEAEYMRFLAKAGETLGKPLNYAEK